MIERHLEAIRSKEEEAKALIREAEVQAGEMIAKARQQGEKRLEDVKIEAAELERSLKAEATARAGKRIKELRDENEAVIRSLGDIARDNRDGALDLIIKAFREGF